MIEYYIDGKIVRIHTNRQYSISELLEIRCKLAEKLHSLDRIIDELRQV